MDSIWATIQNWMFNTNWTDPDAADRVEEAVNTQGVEVFIDPLPGVPFKEAASGNYENIKEEFGLETGRERDIAQLDFQDRQKRFAVDEIDSQFEEFGIRAVADAFTDQAPPELQERFDGVYTEYGPDFYRDIAFTRISQILNDLDLDAELVSEDRLEALQEAAEATTDTPAEEMRDAERRVVDRLEGSFGQRFEDLDDAVESLRNRIDQLQELDVRSGEIALRGNRDSPPSVSVEIGFGEFERAVREQVDRAIDRDAIDVRRTFQERIGSVRVVGDEIQVIDLTPARLIDRVAPAIVNDDELLTRREIEADVAAPPTEEVQPEEAPEPEPIEEPEPAPIETEPEPEPEPEEPEEPEPVTPDDALSANQMEALELALEAAPEGVIALAEALNTSQAFDLAGAVSQESLDEDDRARIADAFQQASAGERRRAAQLQDGVGDLQRALIGIGPGESEDIDIEITGDVGPEDLNGDDDEEEGFLGGLIGEAEPGGPPDEGNGNGNGDLDAEDVIEGLSDLFAGAGQSIETQPGDTQRPDPNQQNADRKLAPLLGNRLLTAQAWVAAEQERLSRDFDDPGRFWDTFGSGIWGNNLSREQFVGLEVPR